MLKYWYQSYYQTRAQRPPSVKERYLWTLFFKCNLIIANAINLIFIIFPKTTGWSKNKSIDTFRIFLFWVNLKLWWSFFFVHLTEIQRAKKKHSQTLKTFRAYIVPRITFNPLSKSLSLLLDIFFIRYNKKENSIRQRRGF